MKQPDSSLPADPRTLQELLAEAEAKGIEIPQDNKDPDMLKTYLRAVLSDDAIECVARVVQEIEKASTPQQLSIAPMPTDMCRISPFFIIDKRKKRTMLDGHVITAGGWGNILYTGPMLSVYDEDILFAVIALIHKDRRESTQQINGVMTYRYKGTIYAILKEGGLSVNQAAYTRCRDALRRMHQGSIELVVNRRDKTGGRVTSHYMRGDHIFANYEIDDKTGEVVITLDKYFYELYGKKNVTWLDAKLRVEIKSQTAKGIYRFLLSHENYVWPTPGIPATYKRFALQSISTQKNNQRAQYVA